MLATLLSRKRPNPEHILNYLGKTLPLIHQLARTPQDSQWHAEGDVYQHTTRVIQALYELLQAHQEEFSNEEVCALILAAALHDIGKPLTTKEREIDGQVKIISPQHESKGCAYLAYRILDLGIPYPIAHKILRLVQLHHKPRHLVLEDGSKADYCALARGTDLRLLYYLAKADTLGRICEDLAGQVELIELFRLQAIEYDLWGIRNPFEHWQTFFKEQLSSVDERTHTYFYSYAREDYEQGLIQSPHEALAKYYGYKKGFPELIMMVGPSGSGKTSWIQKNRSNEQLISLDELRKEMAKGCSDQSKNDQIVQLAKQELKKYLANGQRVIWDATNIRRRYRQIISQIGRNYHALITFVVLHEPLSKVYKGNANRTHRIPEQVIDEQLNSLEWVLPQEAHRTFFIHQSQAQIFD